jgi:hypothetical protein
LNLGNNSTTVANGGTLRLNVSSASTIGTSVSASVTAGATLELAGPISALANGTSRVNVSNSSSAPGILVSGTNQQVGAIDGSGSTQVNAGSDLTANHIIQGALVIGGTAASHGTVTIAASNASGVSFAAMDEQQAPFASLSNSVELPALNSSSLPPLAGLSSMASTISHGEFIAVQLGGMSIGTTAAAVPEPATIWLALLAVVGLAWRRGKQLAMLP